MREEYKLVRLKDISILNPQPKNNHYKNDIVSFIPMECLRNDEIENRVIIFSEAKGKYTYFEENDLLIAKVTPCFENGNIAIAKNLTNRMGFGSSEIFVLRFTCVDPRYIFYYLQSNKFRSLAISTMCGVGGLKRISPLFMRTFELFLPNSQLQIKIKNYLNTKINYISKKLSLLEKKRDSYLSLKKSLINQVVSKGLNSNVEMKDSGIDWLGEVPKHWITYRLKDLGNIYSGLTGKSGDDFRSEDESKNKDFIPFTNILNNFYISSKQLKPVLMDESEQQNKVIKGDLLFLMSSEDYESIGKSALLKDDIGEVYLNSFCKGFRIIKKSAYSAFINYQLAADKFRNLLRFEARGFTRINLKIDKITSMAVLLPPLSEQQAIADYLDDKCTQIDTVVENIEKQIVKLKDLKKSLINEVVTGQRKIEP